MKLRKQEKIMEDRKKKEQIDIIKRKSRDRLSRHQINDSIQHEKETVRCYIFG